MLFWRTRLNAKRNPIVIKARLMQNLVFSIMIGGAFNHCGGDTRELRMNVMGSLFFMTMNQFMVFFMSQIGIFQAQREVVIREYVG